MPVELLLEVRFADDPRLFSVSDEALARSSSDAFQSERLTALC